MTEPKKKLTFTIALFGALGLGALGYAVLRRPRHLYDGRVQACEGSAPFYGIDQKCTELAMTRDNGSGKIFAPFQGSVYSATPVDGKQTLVIQSDSEPVLMQFTLDGGAPTRMSGKFKSGDVIAQSERVKVSMLRKEGTGTVPMAPSAWMIANALIPASQRGSQWCEDSYQVIVPQCEGVTFRAPSLPKWSLRTVRMTM